MATAKKTASKASKKTTAKKRVGTKKKSAPKKKASTTKKTAKKAPVTKKTTAKATKPRSPKHVAGNPYRAGSFYATAFDCLSKMGSKKPVSRKDLLEAYCKASGKDKKRAKYDLAVVLSPSQDGGGHRSSRKLAYWVERLEDGLVRLHMVDK